SYSSGWPVAPCERISSGYGPPLVGCTMRVTIVRSGLAGVSRPASVARDVSTNVLVKELTSMASVADVPSVAGATVASVDDDPVESGELPHDATAIAPIGTSTATARRRIAITSRPAASQGA